MLASLEEQAEKLINNGIAPNTTRVYNSAKKCYLSFCTRLNFQPLPASEHMLILFVAELHQTKSANTIHTYLASVRHLHITAGYSNPLQDTPQLQLSLRVCKRTKSPRPAPRLPKTPHILRQIRATLSNSFVDTLIWAAIVLDFSVSFRQVNLQSTQLLTQLLTCHVRTSI